MSAAIVGRFWFTAEFSIFGAKRFRRSDRRLPLYEADDRIIPRRNRTCRHPDSPRTDRSKLVILRRGKSVASTSSASSSNVLLMIRQRGNLTLRVTCQSITFWIKKKKFLSRSDWVSELTRTLTTHWCTLRPSSKKFPLSGGHFLFKTLIRVFCAKKKSGHRPRSQKDPLHHQPLSGSNRIPLISVVPFFKSLHTRGTCSPFCESRSRSTDASSRTFSFRNGTGRACNFFSPSLPPARDSWCVDASEDR